MLACAGAQKFTLALLLDDAGEACLTCPGTARNCVPVKTEPCKSPPGWVFEGPKDGHFTISSAASPALALDMNQAPPGIILWEHHGQANQLWRPHVVKGSPSVRRFCYRCTDVLVLEEQAGAWECAHPAHRGPYPCQGPCWSCPAPCTVRYCRGCSDVDLCLLSDVSDKDFALLKETCSATWQSLQVNPQVRVLLNVNDVADHDKPELVDIYAQCEAAGIHVAKLKSTQSAMVYLSLFPQLVKRPMSAFRVMSDRMRQEPTGTGRLNCEAGKQLRLLLFARFDFCGHMLIYSDPSRAHCEEEASKALRDTPLVSMAASHAQAVAFATFQTGADFAEDMALTPAQLIHGAGAAITKSSHLGGNVSRVQIKRRWTPPWPRASFATWRACLRPFWAPTLARAASAARYFAQPATLPPTDSPPSPTHPPPLPLFWPAWWSAWMSSSTTISWPRTFSWARWSRWPAWLGRGRRRPWAFTLPSRAACLRTCSRPWSSTR